MSPIQSSRRLKMLGATPDTLRESKTCNKTRAKRSCARKRTLDIVHGSRESYVKHRESRDLELVTVSLLLAFALGGLDAALFHPLSDVVVDERTLGVHQIEFVVNAGHDLRDRRAVRDHAARTHDLSQVTAPHNGRRLVVAH